VAAFLCGAAAAVARPALKMSSLAALKPDPRWGCGIGENNVWSDGYAGDPPMAVAGTIESSGLDIKVYLETKGNSELMSPDQINGGGAGAVYVTQDTFEFKVDHTADIYAFWINGQFYDATRTPEKFALSPKVVNSENSMKLIERTPPAKNCGQENGEFAPLVNGYTGDENTPVPRRRGNQPSDELSRQPVP